MGQRGAAGRWALGPWASCRRCRAPSSRCRDRLPTPRRRQARSPRRARCTGDAPMSRLVLTLLLMVLLPSATWAQERARRPDGEPSDLWSEPNPGVRYLHRTLVEPVPVSVRALVIDLEHPGVRVVATPQSA